MEERSGEDEGGGIVERKGGGRSWSYLAFSLSDVGADVLGLVLALLDEDGGTLLAVRLHPHDGLVGGHVNAELLDDQKQCHNIFFFFKVVENYEIVYGHSRANEATKKMQMC